MARVQPYERVVDAVHHHTSPAILGIEIQNMKIKEEPIDTTSNTDATEDCTLVRNCYSLIDHDYHYRDKLLLKHNILCKDINNIENKHSLNDDSAYSNDVNKTVKLQLKKRKRSNEISNNKNTTPLPTTGNVRKKRKQNITLDCKPKIQRTNGSAKKEFTECDICFRKFLSFRSCEFHKQYYEFNDILCKVCKRQFVTHEKLQSHTCRKRMKLCDYFCNFCYRPFRTKPLLQSHLFHVHNELIHFNTIKRDTSRHRNVNTAPEGDTLRTSVNEECLNNPREDTLKSDKISATLTDNVTKSWDNNVMEIEKSKIEKSLNSEMSTKRLRQPTLTEYLELCKKKRDVKPSPNKMNIMKDDLSVYTLSHDEQSTKKVEGNPRPKLSEEHNGQIDSLSTKSENLPKQMARSILEQADVKHEICLQSKKPFVRLHADVEMMKSFLDKLSDPIVKDEMTQDQTRDSASYDREIPYSLRSLRGVSSVEAGSNSGMGKNKSVSKKSRVNIGFNTKKEQNVIDEEKECIDVDKIDKVEPKVDWKIIMTRFKCKECTIRLTRCDERPKSSYQTSTTDSMKNTSLTQCDSVSSEKSDTQNKIMLKDLEISLERLTTVPSTDTEEAEKGLDIEKHIYNYFLCRVCEKSFSSKLDKRVHIKLSHMAYMSSICGARYKLKHKLLQHYLCEHVSKRNQCCICYMLFPNYEILAQHLNIHCLKYIQREDDKHPTDIDLKCSLNKKVTLEDSCSSKCLHCVHCNKTFSSQSSLEVHQNYCAVQKRMEKDQKDSVKEANAHPKNVPEIQHKKNTNENLVTCDERINPDLCKPLNNNCVEEKSNEPQILLPNEKEPEINEKEPEVNEANQDLLANKNLSEEKKTESVNESQDPKKLLECNNFTVNNQNTAKMQSDEVTIKIYPCDICGKQFQNPKNLEIHIRTFSFPTDICPMCGTGFSSKRYLQTHITAAHVPHISKTYSFHCVFCNQGFFKKYDLRSHILHLHGQQMLNTLTRNLNLNMNQDKSDSVIHTAVCNVCNLVFDTHDRYVEHRMYYYENHTFTCSLCAQNFQGMYMFHHHNKLVHYSEDKRKSYTYICNICNEGFNHETHFYSHNIHVHSNEVNLVQETSKEFEDKNRSDYSPNIQEKIRNFSTDQQKQLEQPSNEYTCKICKLKCKDMNNMVKHTEFYSNDGDFKCDKCNRQFKTFALLDSHKKLTHFYRDVYSGHMCHFCGEILETANILKCHEKHFHSNITGNNTDNCKNGDQISSSNITYKLRKPYESKTNAYNVIEYNCLFCDMKFPTANAIQTHIVHVHMDDMLAKQAILKLALPTSKNKIQKQFVATVSVSSSSISSSSISSLSEDNLTPLLQRSTIQQPNNTLHNFRNNINTTQKDTNDKTTTELFKKPECSKDNKIIEKTPILSIPCVNKSKDISTFSTIATNTESTFSTIVTNTESKADTSVSPSTGSTTFKTVAPSAEFGNNTPVLPSAESTTFRTVAPNIEFRNNTSVLPSTKPTISKTNVPNTSLPIINNDNIQKQFVGTVPSSSTSSSSEDILTQEPNSSVLRNLLNNITSQNEINDKTTTKLFKKLKNACSKNNTIIEKTPVPSIPCINKSKNISTSHTIASKAVTSASSSTGSTTFRTVAPSTKSGNNASVQCTNTTPTISKTIVSNTESKDNTNSSNTSTRCYPSKKPTINKSKTASVSPSSTGPLPPFKDIKSQSWKSNEITNRKSEPVNGHNYSCPLCPLEYPSLMFFHAHLKYAHADSIRSNEMIASRMIKAWTTSTIECLLCPLSFTEENKYKDHLRKSHAYYVYISSSEEVTKNNNVPPITQTNINRKNTIPETITLDDDDDDDDNAKNASDQRSAETTATLDQKTEQEKDKGQNEKIGKLRVKPFAKIIENLSMDSAKFL